MTAVAYRDNAMHRDIRVHVNARTTTPETLNWRLRAPCHRLPADWWDTGDDGNRLAATLCRIACPVRTQCADAVPDPAGIVHAGTAYNDRGQPCPTPACGRPGCHHGAAYHVRGTSGSWYVCDPDLAWAQKLAGIPRTTEPVPDQDDGQDALFDMPKAPAKRAGLR